MDQQFQADVRAYKTEEDYHRDAPNMEAAGWSIGEVQRRPWRGGCMRFILLGSVGDRLFPPREHVVVTYTRGRL